MPLTAIGRCSLLCLLTVWLGSLPLVFGQDKGWKFVLFADTRGSDLVLPINSGILSELARAVVRERPAFMLFGGDYAFWTTVPDLQQWTNIMSPVYAAGIPIYHTLGNHEFDRSAFDNMFSLTPGCRRPWHGLHLLVPVQ